MAPFLSSDEATLAGEGTKLMNLRIGRRSVVTDLRNVHGIEHVVAAAVITVHVDLAFFCQDAINFFIRQRSQRVGTAFA